MGPSTMTLRRPSPPDGLTPDGSSIRVCWTRRDNEIILRSLAARSPPEYDGGVAPAYAPSGARSIRLSPRRRLDRGPIAVLALFGLALLLFLAGGLTFTERSGIPVPRSRRGSRRRKDEPRSLRRHRAPLRHDRTPVSRRLSPPRIAAAKPWFAPSTTRSAGGTARRLRP